MSTINAVTEEPKMPELLDEADKCVGSDNDENKDWHDWHADDDETEASSKTQCIACAGLFDAPEQCLAHIKQEHSFDLFSFVRASTDDSSLRMYHFIKLINYLRASKPASPIKITDEDWKSDKWLKSTLEDDPLLYLDLDDEDADDDAPFRLPISASSQPIHSFKDVSREELEKRLAKALDEQHATTEKLAYLEQHLASLQRLNKSLLDGALSKLLIVYH
jgi:hypothetical protein